jgi:Peptidase A4 family
MLDTPGSTHTLRPAKWTLRLLVALLVVLAMESLPADAGVTAASPQLHLPAAGPVRRISRHWAGYVTTLKGGAFTAVQATWVQPRIRCDRPNSSVAFWIGLGGAARSATGLEQIGTSADCSDTLVPSYSAWSELIPVPAHPVELPISVAPGDKITAQISAGDTTVTFTLRNVTTDQEFLTETTADLLDLSSAEWIAEAPSFCLYRCTALPLANFGTVTFTSATARVDAHMGTITDSAWIHQPIKLATTREQPAAVPSLLSADGGSFSIRWRGPHRGLRLHGDEQNSP